MQNNIPSQQDLTDWTTACLIDRIVVWDRWIEAKLIDSNLGEQAKQNAIKVLIERCKSKNDNLAV